MMTWVVLGAVLFLAWSNGGNDNFKGVATLYGSRTTTYRRALAWATATTLAGSLLTLVLAGGLVKVFSAKGLVPEATAATPAFLGAAALGAAVTLLVATFAGMPVSTTHALTGALRLPGQPGPAVQRRGLGRARLRDVGPQSVTNCSSSSTLTFSPRASLSMPSGMLKSTPKSLR